MKALYKCTCCGVRLEISDIPNATGEATVTSVLRVLEAMPDEPVQDQTCATKKMVHPYRGHIGIFEIVAFRDEPK